MSRNHTEEIWAEVGITRNLGDFNSMRLATGASKIVENINDEESWKELWQTVHDQLEGQLVELEAARNEQG